MGFGAKRGKSIRQQLDMLQIFSCLVDRGFGDVVVADVQGTQRFHFLEESGNSLDLVAVHLDFREGRQLGQDARNFGEIVVVQNDLGQARQP